MTFWEKVRSTAEFDGVVLFKTGEKPVDKKARKFQRKSTMRIDFKSVNSIHIKKSIDTLDAELVSLSESPTEKVIHALKTSSKSLPVHQKATTKAFPWDNDQNLKSLLHQRRGYHILN